MPYNLNSPNRLLEPFDPTNVAKWLVSEAIQIDSEPVRNVLFQVAGNLNEFVKWPARAVLLWEGCDRRRPDNKNQKYHRYPESIRQLSKEQRINLDSRPNGPAIAAFQVAGGERPVRFGSSNSWTIHHVYSGKYPYIDKTHTTHASKECRHFTQSAGLIATHPIADAMCDEFPFFAWLVRAESFRRFGYDPDGVFALSRDEFGFIPGRACQILARGDTPLLSGSVESRVSVRRRL
jgi:hypothetical protein